MRVLKERFVAIMFLLLFVYLCSYVVVRNRHTHLWEKNKTYYVVFPEDKILYYLYRPLTIADGALTGMEFHIGRHR